MIAVDPLTDILGVVDVQPTFMPGGELPVADGNLVVPAINRLLAGPFAHAFATQDWHPRGHSSFASAHQGRQPFETVAMPYGRRCSGRIMLCRTASTPRFTPGSIRRSWK